MKNKTTARCRVTIIALMCGALTFGADPTSAHPIGVPQGSLDEVTMTTGPAVHLGGWAHDPDVPAPIEVHVYVDGRGAAIVRAADTRPDLVPPLDDPHHAFTADVAVAPGYHEVCVWAINAANSSGDNVELGCRDVHADSRIIGSFDVATDTTRMDLDGNVYGGELQGWAIDPDDPDAVLIIAASVDGVVTGGGYAGTYRPDVSWAFPWLPPNRGFSFRSGTPPGAHQMCAIARNVAGTAGEDILLGCKQPFSHENEPIGHLDRVRRTTGGVALAGWVVDPWTADWNPYLPPAEQGVGALEQVRFTVDGVPTLHATVDIDREDVARALGSARGPRHMFRVAPAPRFGFDEEIPLTPGSHEVCVIGEHHPAPWYSNKIGGDAAIGCAKVGRL